MHDSIVFLLLFDHFFLALFVVVKGYLYFEYV